MRKYLILLILLWNVFVFLLYGYDKRRAKKDKRRVPEKTLLVCAAVFGALGAFAGMQVFHHKTKKKRFNILVPVLLILQIAVLVYLKF